MKPARYKWTLRKGGSKMVCPSCGRKTFVPYVSATDGKTLAGAEYGRCDRENHCGYLRYPGSDVTAPEGSVKAPEPPSTPLRFKASVLAALDGRSKLHTYAERFGVGATMAMRAYKVGSYGRDWTAFCQIDTAGEIHAVKLIPYGVDGHRRKDMTPVRWGHKDKSLQSYCDGERLEQVAFGEHLLRLRPSSPVAVVESEKTAVMMSALFPQAVWLAVGGSQNLYRIGSRLNTLKEMEGRKVIAYPDKGMSLPWQQTCGILGWECRDEAVRRGELGCDIWDIYEQKISVTR